MKLQISSILLSFLLFFSGCYNFKVTTSPSDARIYIDGQYISSNSLFKSKINKVKVSVERYGYKEINQTLKKITPFGTKIINLQLEPEIFDVNIETIKPGIEIIFNSLKIGKTPLNISLPYGEHSMFFEQTDYPKEEVLLKASYNGQYYFKHHKDEMKIKQLGIFKCGPQPKQVIFSPDSRFIYIVLLDGYGYQVFDIEKMQIVDYVKAPDESLKRGFVEGLFIEEKNVFLVSQMNTGFIYEYSYPENKFLRKFNTEGTWSKYIAWSDELSLIAVSNWASNDVSIIDYQSGKVVSKIKTAPAPRGLVFTEDSKYLYITSYDGGVIYKIKTADWSVVKSISKERSCMRHAVLTQDNKRLFVSDMYSSIIYEVDANGFKISGSYKVYEKPNTIFLSSNDKYLFVSSRGPNNKESYLKRSPENGRISIIDIDKKEIISSFEAGNQPTALGLSKDGKYLCTSDFRDDTIELFYIGDLR